MDETARVHRGSRRRSSVADDTASRPGWLWGNCHHNPLTRIYESNGPNVKVRGSASLIAEKYQQLARDTQTSGDQIAAESYLQHAEHYNRLIAAAQEQFRQ